MAPLVPRDHVPDRLGFFRNGWLLDEVVLTSAAFSLRRTSQARYVAQIATACATVELDLWTTPRGRVQSRLYDGPPPHWLRATLDGECVDALEGESLSVHFEHLDRNFYHLGISQADERWFLNFAGAGYLKLAPRASDMPLPAEVHLDSTPPPAQLRDALGFAARVRPDRLVFVLLDELPGPPLRPGEILVMVTERDGEFTLSLGLSSTQQEITVAARLARSLGCRALVSDRSLNPYTWTLITREGSILQAHVDVDVLNEREALTITRAG
jgi:hypothetical protein